MLDKDKNLPIPRVVNRIDLPSGFSDYMNMNIQNGDRIGFQQKQEYISFLSDLYSEGYLTEEEYDSRVELVNVSQTSQQAALAFGDLRKALQEMAVKEYVKNIGKNDSSSRKPFIISAITMFSVVTCCAVTAEALSGSWIWLVLLLTEAFLIITAWQLSLFDGKRK